MQKTDVRRRPFFSAEVFEAVADADDRLARRRLRGAAHGVSCLRRSAGEHHARDVAFKDVAHGLELAQGEVAECLFVLEAVSYDLARDRVGIAEGNALLGEVVGNVGRRREALACGLEHGVGVEGHLLEHGVEDGNAVEHRLFGVEERLLVLLQILVVGKGERLERREEARKVADDPPALAADEFGDVGILLLRHDGGARRVGVGDLPEAELVRGIEDGVLGEAGEVQHDFGEAEEVFRHEVAVGHGVDGAARDVVELQKRARDLAVDGEGGARERRAAEGHHVDALPAVLQPVHVAQEHLGIGVEVLREVDGLRLAQVGVAGKDALDVLVCGHRERRHEGVQKTDEVIDGIARVEAQVGRHLVVAGARRVQLLAHFADAPDELVFDKGVDVLGALDGERAAVDVVQDAAKPFRDAGGLFGRDDVGLAEHGRMGDGGGDIGPVELFVKGERFVERIGIFCGGSVKSSFPKFHYVTSQRIVCIFDFTRFLCKIYFGSCAFESRGTPT